MKRENDEFIEIPEYLRHFPQYGVSVYPYPVPSYGSFAQYPLYPAAAQPTRTPLTPPGDLNIYEFRGQFKSEEADKWFSLLINDIATSTKENIITETAGGKITIPTHLFVEKVITELRKLPDDKIKNHKPDILQVLSFVSSPAIYRETLSLSAMRIQYQGMDIVTYGNLIDGNKSDYGNNGCRVCPVLGIINSISVSHGKDDAHNKTWARRNILSKLTDAMITAKGSTPDLCNLSYVTKFIGDSFSTRLMSVQKTAE